MTQHQQDFIARVGTLAVQDMARSGILASVTIAQAILESGWGRSELAVHAKALFGIKADKRWNGKTYSIKTKEWYDGKNPVTITDTFRAYGSWEDSLADHSKFLMESERYRRILGERSYKAACTELYRAGYCTDPDYAKKLIGLIERYQLTQYDREDTMQINKKLANRKNFGGNRNAVRFIVVHYTANKGDTAKNNADYFAREQVGASAHFFVDELEIWESVPVTECAWHCGAKTYRHTECRNANSIGVEICMNDKNGKLRQGSIDHAVRLIRMLMQNHNVSIDRVLRHFDVTGKQCPAPMVQDPIMWQAFRNQLTNRKIEQEENENMKVYKHTTDMPDWAQGTFRRLIDAGVVKVDAKGEIAVQEFSLQPMVYFDRLCGGKIEWIPKIMSMLISLYKLCGGKIDELPKFIQQLTERT